MGFFLKDAAWSVVHVDDEFIVIKDLALEGHNTITNQIYQVTSKINAEYDLTKRRLIYCDSMGLYDGIENREDGNFYNFLYIGVADHLQAMKIYKEKFNRQFLNIIDATEVI